MRSGEGTSGSTAWNNASRSRLYLRRPKNARSGNVRELEGMKTNYGPQGSLLKLQWKSGAFEVLATSMPRSPETISIASIEDSVEAAVISVLLSHPGERLVLDKRNSQYFAPKRLKQLDRETLNACSHDEIEAALLRLNAAGTIRIMAVGRDSYSREIFGLAVNLNKFAAAGHSVSGIFG
jgi:hypothetical protein